MLILGYNYYYILLQMSYKFPTIDIFVYIIFFPRVHLNIFHVLLFCRAYSMFWWATVLVAVGAFLYYYMRRRGNTCHKPHQSSTWPPPAPEPQLIPMQDMPTGNERLYRDPRYSQGFDNSGEDTLFDRSQIGPIQVPPPYEETPTSEPTNQSSQSDVIATSDTMPQEPPPSYESVVNEHSRNQ